MVAYKLLVLHGVGGVGRIKELRADDDDAVLVELSGSAPRMTKLYPPEEVQKEGDIERMNRLFRTAAGFQSTCSSQQVSLPRHSPDIHSTKQIISPEQVVLSLRSGNSCGRSGRSFSSPMIELQCMPGHPLLIRTTSRT